MRLQMIHDMEGADRGSCYRDLRGQRKSVRLVHYVPGDAPGSPAWMTRRDAERQLSRDMRYCATMESAGFNMALPYIEH